MLFLEAPGYEIRDLDFVFDQQDSHRRLPRNVKGQSSETKHSPGAPEKQEKDAVREWKEDG
jgi:hypothetical protein